MYGRLRQQRSDAWRRAWYAAMANDPNSNDEAYESNASFQSDPKTNGSAANASVQHRAQMHNTRRHERSTNLPIERSDGPIHARWSLFSTGEGSLFPGILCRGRWTLLSCPLPRAHNPAFRRIHGPTRTSTDMCAPSHARCRGIEVEVTVESKRQQL